MSENLQEKPPKLNIALVMSSTREGRLNDRVTKFVHNAVMEKGHDVEIIDPATIDFPKTQQSLNFLLKEKGDVPPKIKELNKGDIPQNIKDLNEKMKSFDAFVIICSEYNYSIPPALADLFDNIPPTTLSWKPCGFVNYAIGQFGGSRVAVHLRTFTGALGMISVPKNMLIPYAHETISEDGIPANEKLKEELNLSLEHVYYAANALKNHQAIATPPPWAP